MSIERSEARSEMAASRVSIERSEARSEMAASRVSIERSEVIVEFTVRSAIGPRDSGAALASAV